MEHLFLIGYMGVGKSRVGNSLSRLSGIPFNDLDERIERKSECSIPELFDKVGESGFRRIESEVLEELVHQTTRIIACGGGTPCQEGNLDLLQEKGTLVHLKAEPGKILERCSKDPDKRPVIKGMDEAAIQQHLIERLPYYQQADLTLEVKEQSPEELAERVLAFYSR
ncbi:MAG: shikimate kinase [Flavobacteriales bacterium]